MEKENPIYIASIHRYDKLHGFILFVWCVVKKIEKSNIYKLG